MNILQRGPRPKCQCAERKEAMKRATAFTAAGDLESAAKEMDFVKKSMIEDTIAMKNWALGNPIIGKPGLPEKV